MVPVLSSARSSLPSARLIMMEMAAFVGQVHPIPKKRPDSLHNRAELG